MDLLAKGYSALRGEKGLPQSSSATIEKLCDRVANATLLEDKRAAVLSLKGLAKEYKLEVGTKGLPVLTGQLKKQKKDSELGKAILETLSILCTSDKVYSPTGEIMKENDLGLELTEIYIKDPLNISVLLELLSQKDVYLRFDTLQLLRILLENKPDFLQDAILTSPMGIPRLMDLLDDARDIIRNESLLLLISITESNADIQKIIVFENAFDRLLTIIAHEGGVDGGIIVQDCFHLVSNLLKYNVSNQNYFRETSCIQKLGKILTSAVDVASNNGGDQASPKHSWDDQKVKNVIMLLEIIVLLVVPNNQSTPGNQNVMLLSGVLETVTELALHPETQPKVKPQALYALADIVRGNKKNQDEFARKVTRPNIRRDSNPNFTDSKGGFIPVPAIVVLISLAMGDYNSTFSIRAAATYAFQCYVFQNQDGQLAIASTIRPPPPEDVHSEESIGLVSAGSYIITSFLNWKDTTKDPYRVWFSGNIFSYILNSNERCKEIALKLKLGDSNEDDNPSLIHQIVHSLIVSTRENADIRVLIGYISLLCVWAYDSPKTVKEFLNEGANLQFFIEQITQNSGIDPVIQGLAALFVGICYEFNEETDTPFPKSQLYTIISSRIGTDQFTNRIRRLRESPKFSHASSYQQMEDSDSKTQPIVYFDYGFVEFVKYTFEKIQQSVSVAPAQKAKDPSSRNVTKEVQSSEKNVGSPKQTPSGSNPNDSKTIAKLESENLKLSNTIKELEKKVKEEKNGHEMQIQALNDRIQTLQNQLTAMTSKQASLEKEQEDLLVCLAEQEIDNRKLKSRLREYGEHFDDDDEEEEDSDENE